MAGGERGEQGKQGVDLGGGDGAVALVLAGAVAQGAFGVGAAASIAKKGWPVQRIAATSSGALSAAVLGAGVATGQLAYATQVAKDLWINHGAFDDIRHVRPSDLLHARGLLDTTRLVALVEEGIRRVMESDNALAGRGGARLTLVAASLNAVPEGCGPLPTYEKAMTFEPDDYFEPLNWKRIATAAAASATFPGLFSPTMVDGMPCVDGGAVNNAPISYVLDEPAVRRVVIVTSEPSPLPPATDYGGQQLLSRLADVLINERVSHDLGVASRTNTLLRNIRAALEATGASAETAKAVFAAIGWREIDLLVVHPDPPLPGSSFSGFFDRSLRESYIVAGEEAADRVFGRS
jgi:predicted acylesterase/phospholipase RssA